MQTPQLRSVSPRTLLFLTGKPQNPLKTPDSESLNNNYDSDGGGLQPSCLTADTVILLAVTAQGIHLQVDTELIPWIHL